MKIKRFAAALAAALVVGVGATAAHAEEPAPTTTCLPDNADGAWPPGAQGMPARSPGVTVWHDTNGWHVRVTHNTIKDRVFSGVVKTRGELIDVTSVRLERNDYVKVGPEKHAVAFRFHNYGGVDGFDFKTRCAPALQFAFVSDGHLVPKSRIAIGAAGAHPHGDPFVIKRTA